MISIRRKCTMYIIIAMCILDSAEAIRVSSSTTSGSWTESGTKQDPPGSPSSNQNSTQFDASEQSVPQDNAPAQISSLSTGSHKSNVESRKGNTEDPFGDDDMEFADSSSKEQGFIAFTGYMDNGPVEKAMERTTFRQSFRNRTAVVSKAEFIDSDEELSFMIDLDLGMEVKLRLQKGNQGVNLDAVLGSKLAEATRSGLVSKLWRLPLLQDNITYLELQFASLKSDTQQEVAATISQHQSQGLKTKILSLSAGEDVIQQLQVLALPVIAKLFKALCEKNNSIGINDVIHELSELEIQSDNKDDNEDIENIGSESDDDDGPNVVKTINFIASGAEPSKFVDPVTKAASVEKIKVEGKTRIEELGTIFLNIAKEYLVSESKKNDSDLLKLQQVARSVISQSELSVAQMLKNAIRNSEHRHEAYLKNGATKQERQLANLLVNRFKKLLEASQVEVGNGFVRLELPKNLSNVSHKAVPNPSNASPSEQFDKRPRLAGVKYKHVDGIYGDRVLTFQVELSSKKTVTPLTLTLKPRNNQIGSANRMDVGVGLKDLIEDYVKPEFLDFAPVTGRFEQFEADLHLGGIKDIKEDLQTVFRKYKESSGDIDKIDEDKWNHIFNYMTYFPLQGQGSFSFQAKDDEKPLQRQSSVNFSIESTFKIQTQGGWEASMFLAKREDIASANTLSERLESIADSIADTIDIAEPENPNEEAKVQETTENTDNVKPASTSSFGMPSFSLPKVQDFRNLSFATVKEYANNKFEEAGTMLKKKITTTKELRQLALKHFLKKRCDPMQALLREFFSEFILKAFEVKVTFPKSDSLSDSLKLGLSVQRRTCTQDISKVEKASALDASINTTAITERLRIYNGQVSDLHIPKGKKAAFLFVDDDGSLKRIGFGARNVLKAALGTPRYQRMSTETITDKDDGSEALKGARIPKRKFTGLPTMTQVGNTAGSSTILQKHVKTALQNADADAGKGLVKEVHFWKEDLAPGVEQVLVMVPTKPTTNGPIPISLESRTALYKDAIKKAAEKGVKYLVTYNLGWMWNTDDYWVQQKLQDTWELQKSIRDITIEAWKDFVTSQQGDGDMELVIVDYKDELRTQYIEALKDVNN